MPRSFATAARTIASSGSPARVLEELVARGPRLLCLPGTRERLRAAEEATPGAARFDPEGREAEVGTGLAHLSVKPRHVMITWEGRVKLIDLGWARWSREPYLDWRRGWDDEPRSRWNQHWHPGRRWFHAYHSPEQERGAFQVGPQSDVFSAAVVLAELAGGLNPFAHRDRIATRTAILLAERQPAPAWGPRWPVSGTMQ